MRWWPGRKCIGAALLLLAAWTAVASAQVPQVPRVRVLGVREGLPSTSVRAIERDKAGYIWVGTSDGLARYDGAGFRVWQHDPRDDASLAGNLVQAMHIDARDRVWVATEFTGVNMLDSDRRGFRHIRPVPGSALESEDIWAITSQGDTVWFGTADAGLTRRAPDGSMRTWRTQDGLPSDTILALSADDAGRLWIGTDVGLAVMEGEKLRAVSLPGAEPAPLIYAVVWTGGKLWVGSGVGVFQREAGDRWTQPAWSAMFERPNAMMGLQADKDGSLWLASQRHLWRIAPDGSPPLIVESDAGDLPRPVQDLLLQSDGALWVPRRGGLGYLRSDWRRIAELRQDPTGVGLRGEQYRHTAPARKGGVWMAGTNANIERVDGSGVVERLSEAARVPLNELMPLRPNAVTEAANGDLWVSDRGGLIRLAADGRLDRWDEKSPEDAPMSGGINQLALSPDGRRLWASSEGRGLQERDAVTGRVLRDIVVGPDSGLGRGDTEWIIYGPDGRLWVATGLGLGVLDENAGRVRYPRGLDTGRVDGFDFVDANTLWLHQVAGLQRYVRDGDGWKQVEKFGTDAGLPALDAGGLRVDRHGRVWLITQRGLFRWDPKRRYMRSYGVQHGLNSQEFNDRSLSLTASGILAATTADGGVVMVDTTAAEPVIQRPQLRIEGLQVRRDGDWVQQPVSDTFTLKPGDGEFRLQARLLSFDDPGSVRYWSRLQGMERSWVDQGAQGDRVFSGLAPGHYILHLRATDPAGNVTETQALNVVVEPPAWRSRGAYALYVLSALLLTTLLLLDFRRRVRRGNELALAEEKRLLAEQASEAKSRFLATMGHEIRTPMTGVLGMTELLRSASLPAEQRGQVDAIWRAGRHLLRLVNDALDLARIEAGKFSLNQEAFDVRTLVDDAVHLMLPVAQRKGLAFSAQVDAAVPQRVLGDRTRVEQILLNLLGNAIKFTAEGSVQVQVEALSPQGLRFRIADTGMGMDDEQQRRVFERFEQAEGASTAAKHGGTGLGLPISQELAHAMGGSIRLRSAPGRGAEFTVELPLPAAADLAAAEAAQVDGQSVEGLALLLVEDDATVSAVIAGLLQQAGHRVVAAPHALAAFAEVSSQRFDAGLLDIDLPGMDGFSLGAQLRANGFDGPLLVITARADAEAERAAEVAGFDYFLRKPVTGELLSEALRQAFARRSLKNQRAE